MFLFLNTFLKIFFLLTPFAAVSSFVSMSQGNSLAEKKSIVLRTTIAMFVFVSIIFFFGQYIFQLFGITLDAFRIGGGILLLLTGINLVKGVDSYTKGQYEKDIAVVPMAIPIIVGPGTIAALFIMGTEQSLLHYKLISLLAVFLAVCSVSVLLFVTIYFEQKITKKVISLFSKITGLILASLACQIIFDGIHNIMLSK